MKKHATIAAALLAAALVAGGLWMARSAAPARRSPRSAPAVPALRVRAGEVRAAPRVPGMPRAAERVKAFLAARPLGAEVVAGLREVAALQRELAAPAGGPQSAEQKLARRQRREEFRALLRDVLGRMEPGQRAAMRRARLTVLQIARHVDES